MKQSSKLSALFSLLVVGLAVPAEAQHRTTNMRLFWVNHNTQKLSYGDVVTTDKWALSTGTVDGFPKTDLKNRIAPMVDRNGLIVAGISGTENDKKKGRWVAIDSGVYQEPHGNHFHWKYTGRPTVTQTVAEDRQGPVSRVRFSGDQLYLLGDKGFSSASLNNLRIRGTTTGTSRFFPATEWPVASLALVDNVVGYAAWSDEKGEHAGQVDVIKLADPAKPAYSFKLPSGNITATAANSGKVFFAHKDTISWVAPDRSFSLASDKVKINTVAVPANQQFKLENLPAALVNERSWVTFTTGTGESSKLCMIDASAATPTMIALPIKINEGLRLSAPKTVLSLGKRYAFIFHQRIEPDSQAKEQLTIIELDPNRDMRFDDARIAKTIPIGSSKIKDNAGHHQVCHQVCFDAYGRFAVFTNPGDGTLTVMTMQDLQVRVNFKVDGVPTQIVAVGAPEHFH